MKIGNNTEKLLFLNRVHSCEYFFENYSYYCCKKTNQICDFDHCYLLKQCATIEEFIFLIENKIDLFHGSVNNFLNKTVENKINNIIYKTKGIK